MDISLIEIVSEILIKGSKLKKNINSQISFLFNSLQQAAGIKSNYIPNRTLSFRDQFDLEFSIHFIFENLVSLTKKCIFVIIMQE